MLSNQNLRFFVKGLQYYSKMLSQHYLGKSKWIFIKYRKPFIYKGWVLYYNQIFKELKVFLRVFSSPKSCLRNIHFVYRSKEWFYHNQNIFWMYSWLLQLIWFFTSSQLLRNHSINFQLYFRLCSIWFEKSSK